MWGGVVSEGLNLYIDEIEVVNGFSRRMYSQCMIFIIRNNAFHTIYSIVIFCVAGCVERTLGSSTGHLPQTVAP